MKRCLARNLAVVGTLLFSSVLRAEDALICKGNLSIQINENHKINKIKSTREPVLIQARLATTVTFGITAATPALVVLPWGEIVAHETPWLLEQKKNLALNFETDGWSWFTVTIRGRRTGAELRTTCRMLGVVGNGDDV
jgi:hypothetical protein